jgi:hypothetical protein
VEAAVANDGEFIFRGFCRVYKNSGVTVKVGFIIKNKQKFKDWKKGR